MKENGKAAFQVKQASSGERTMEVASGRCICYRVPGPECAVALVIALNVGLWRFGVGCDTRSDN